MIKNLRRGRRCKGRSNYLRRMRLLYCLPLFFWMAVLPAQDTYFTRLAGEVCSCMERVSVEPVDLQATNCMREVALANEETLRKRYGLIAAEAAQRDLLADRLTGDLLSDCPLLATLNFEREEEDRWADRDRPTAEELRLFKSAKGPPADPAGTITGEPPAEWVAEGAVQRLAGGNMLLLLTTGETMELELPTGVSRLRRIRVGDELRLSFRREWRKGENRIVNVILGVGE